MDRNTIDIVQELLAAEQGSMALRLAESTLFVAPLGAAEATALARIADEINEHSAWLADLLATLGQSPGPRTGDLSTGDLHFQEVSYAFPRLTADLTHLTKLCERAAAKVTNDQAVATVVARMTDRHRQHVATLEALSRPTPGDAA